MDSVKSLATKMCPKLQENLEAKGFVIETFIIVSALVSILVNLVKLNRMCKNTPKEALDRIRKPGLVDSIRIRKIIRSAVKDKSLKIPKGPNGDPAITLIEQAVAEAAVMINEDDVKVLIEAIGE